MKKITQAEYDQLPGTVRQGNKSEFMSMVEALEVGEGLFIELADWHLKASPVSRVTGENRRLKTGKKFSGKTVPGQGWSIIRKE